MYTFLLVILIIDSLVLVAAILMQAAKGGGLAASFGGVTTAADAFMGSRQAGNVLTKVSWWAGGAFLFLAFVLQILSTRGRAPTSILEQGLPAPPARHRAGDSGPDLRGPARPGRQGCGRGKEESVKT